MVVFILLPVFYIWFGNLGIHFTLGKHELYTSVCAVFPNRFVHVIPNIIFGITMSIGFKKTTQTDVGSV